jgi:hypothetical protein
MSPSLPMLLGVATCLLACEHAPRVIVPPRSPARIESFDRVTGQAEVVILGRDGPMKGWMPMSELQGRTVFVDDSWLLPPSPPGN